MNRRFISVLLFAFVVAGLATLLFYRLIAGRLSSESKPVTTQVFVAARVLGVGTLVRDMDVTLAPWAGQIPPSAVLKKEDIVGRGVVSTMYQGEPILEARLAPKGAGAGLAATIPPGMRAVAVRVNEIIGVSGFVTAGMRVDILISGLPPGVPATLGTLSKTLLQNIEVLSAGQSIQKDAEGKPLTVPVVNLLVTPEQAEVLSLASTQTQIQLVLRNPLDTEIAKTNGTTVKNLFSGTKFSGMEWQGEKPRPRPRVVSKPAVPVVPAVKEKPPVVVEIIQGGRRDTTKFTEESR